jgi:hypothetical protein
MEKLWKKIKYQHTCWSRSGEEPTSFTTRNMKCPRRSRPICINFKMEKTKNNMRSTLIMTKKKLYNKNRKNIRTRTNSG